MVKERNRRFLYRGKKIAVGDKVRSLDPATGSLEFYEVVRVWGAHAVMRVISESEAGAAACVVVLTPEV